MKKLIQIVQSYNQVAFEGSPDLIVCICIIFLFCQIDGEVADAALRCAAGDE